VSWWLVLFVAGGYLLALIVLLAVLHRWGWHDDDDD
jgi:hypothetical protein